MAEGDKSRITPLPQIGVLGRSFVLQDDANWIFELGWRVLLVFEASILHRELSDSHFSQSGLARLDEPDTLV